jgi:hypothetical protein
MVKGFKDWIALITAIIALSTAIIHWFRTSTELDLQKERIARLEGCFGVIADIKEPTNGIEVLPPVDISGTSTIHETCHYVFIVIRDRSAPVWKITDLVQVSTTGQWAGVAKLDEIPVGGWAEVTARVTARPTDYRIGQSFPIPPVKGVPSDIIRVRKKQ